MKIVHFKKLQSCPYLPDIIRAWSVILNSGIGDQSAFILNWDNQAIVAVDENNSFLGVMVYVICDFRDVGFVKLGFVNPSHRRQGIYASLFEELKKILPETIKAIEGASSADNKNMLAFCEKHDRKVYATIYRYDLEKK